MFIKQSSRCFLALTLISFAFVSKAAIYRPAGSTSTLFANIISANASPEDDIIDLGGFIYVYAAVCSDPSCITSEGQNAFPPILSAATAGKLSVINGTIQRSAALGTPNFRFFEALASSDFSLFNITLDNGNINDGGTGAPDSGGAIYNFGLLKLQNSTISNNMANDSGGAIYNGGTLDIQSSNISANTAADSSQANGGGGGIYNAPGGIIGSIDYSTISGNSTAGFGGGINNQGSANNIFSSTISGNNCCIPVPGGVCPNPPTGSGGGIYNDGAATQLVLINSTLEGNIAYQGAGIYNNSSALLTSTTGTSIYNSTIANNTANAGGGGIYNNNNSNAGTGPAIISNLFSNIVAANIDTNEISIATPDIQNFDDGGATDSIITNWGYNLVGDNSGVDAHIFPGDGNNDIAGTATNPIDPMLGHLKNNGGFTATMALFPGSQAINMGLNPLNLVFDQRGKGYSRVVCSRPDIGAYERQTCFGG